MPAEPAPRGAAFWCSLWPVCTADGGPRDPAPSTLDGAAGTWPPTLGRAAGTWPPARSMGQPGPGPAAEGQGQGGAGGGEGVTPPPARRLLSQAVKCPLETEAWHRLGRLGGGWGTGGQAWRAAREAGREAAGRKSGPGPSAIPPLQARAVLSSLFDPNEAPAGPSSGQCLVPLTLQGREPGQQEANPPPLSHPWGLGWYELETVSGSL